jgi:type I restriction enzyme M protein
MGPPARKVEAKPLERKLWDAADALRSNQDASEYKHVVLGLLFLKYISDRFEGRRSEIEAELVAKDLKPEQIERLIENRDVYTNHSAFWVPAAARWGVIQKSAKQPQIGQSIDNAMDLIERENPKLRGVLPSNYSRENLDKGRLGQLVDIIGSIGFTESDDHGSDDVLGRVYAYFLAKFAGSETGNEAAAFYTTSSVVRTLVEMLEPYRGRVYDPACGSGGTLVQSAEFVKAHGGKRNDISVYGQELNPTTWKLAKMNLALRGIDADLGDGPADSFAQDLHPKLRADFVLANPPFNVSDWWNAKLTGDPRWKYGMPPNANANFAWVQHIVYHLSPSGTAGFVLANGSLSSRMNGEDEIRRNLIEADLVDCIVAMPDKLFFNTLIPVSLWLISKDRGGKADHRARNGEVLFIDARSLGDMVSRNLRELTESDIAQIAHAYHSWRNRDGNYEDVPNFAKAATTAEIKANGFVLTPARYLGTAAAEVEYEPAEDRIERLFGELLAAFDRGRELEQEVRLRLEALR